MAKGIIVVAEQIEGSLRKITFEVTSEARRLADDLGEPLTAVVIGADVEAAAGRLVQFGADEIPRGDNTALTVCNLLQVDQEGVAPEPLEVVIGAPLFGEHVNDQLAEIKQNPLTPTFAFYIEGFAYRFDASSDSVCHCFKVPVRGG